MSTGVNYRKKIADLTKELTEEKVKALIDFAQFLKEKQEDFSYTQVTDSAAYVRRLRAKESRRRISGRKYIDELMEWQKLNS